MRIVRDERGTIALQFALMLPVLLGLCGIAFDLATLRYNQAQLQLAADAGALAAASTLANPTTAKATAVRVSQLNAPQRAPNITSTADVDLGTYDSATKSFVVSSQNPNAARVRAFRNSQHNNVVPTLFTTFMGLPSVYPVQASATAVAGNAYCLYVLDPSASGAVQFVGGVALNSPCGLQINSASSTAITTFGLFSVNVSATCIVGRYFAFALGGFNPTPKTGCSSRPDPLASLPEPSVVSSCQSIGPLVIGGTLNPGCYTGTIIFSGTVTLKPGLFQFQNAQVSLLGAAQLKGDGVTLYFNSKSTFNMVVLSALDLAAPTSGDYQGVVLFYSRAAANSSLNLVGGSLVSLNGTIYAPATNLTLTGVGSITTKYGYVVVNRLIATGLGTMNFDAFPSDPRRPSAMNSRSVLAL